jgi:hypothetical protein
MGQHRFTKEEAAKAGATKGKHRKTVEWEQLGEYITEKGAKRVMAYLDDIEDDEEFFAKYERLLNYFKPKMQSAEIGVDGNINIPAIIGVRIIDDN